MWVRPDIFVIGHHRLKTIFCSQMNSNAFIDAKTREIVGDRALILYDGDCGFCQWWVQFILDHDPRAKHMFAPLQRFTDRNDLETVLLFEKGEIYQKSAALIKISTNLGFPWTLARIFYGVPRPLRDMTYDFVAKRRKHLSKLSASCRALGPDELTRFL